MPLICRHHDARVEVVLAMNETQRMCVAGACTEANAWTLSGDWKVNQLVGDTLLYLDEDETGVLRVRRSENGDLEISPKVVAVLNQDDEIEHGNFPLSMTTRAGQPVVRVVLGNETVSYTHLTLPTILLE